MRGAILKSQDVQVQPKGALSLISTATTYNQRNLCPQNKGWKWGQLQPSNVNSWEKISWQKKIKTTYCQLGFECAKMELFYSYNHVFKWWATSLISHKSEATTKGNTPGFCEFWVIQGTCSITINSTNEITLSNTDLFTFPLSKMSFPTLMWVTGN